MHGTSPHRRSTHCPTKAAQPVPPGRFVSAGGITAVSLAEPPLDQLAAFGGATGGALLIYIAPALMTLRLHHTRPRLSTGLCTPHLRSTPPS